MAAMTQRILRVLTAGVLALLLMFPPPAARACGPDFSLPTYTNFGEPDDPAAFAQGKLGLLESGYWHTYLFEAYRNLSGKPFTKEELAALNVNAGSSPAATPAEQIPEQNWLDTWQAKRAEALGEKPKQPSGQWDAVGIIRTSMHDDQYLQYYNCLSGAFEYAVHTLEGRTAQYGAQSEVVKEWIAAQDQVFANCSAGPGYPMPTKAAVIPAPAQPADPTIVRADRAYQIAAALFYAGDLDAAQRAFEDIARDANSPHQKLAPYLRARTLVRKAALATKVSEYDAKYLGEAEAQLRAVLADPTEAEFHPAAQRLMGFLSIRLHRQDRFRELESELSTASSVKSVSQDLADYLWLLDHPVLTKTVTITPAADGKPAQTGVTVDQSSRLQGGDMTDWILTFHQTGKEAFEHSLQKWHETKSLPWLVSAVAHAGPEDAALNELLAAASRVAPDSPAYVTVTFHRLRLMAQTGLLDAARRGTDAFLAQHSEALPISARNEFRALRMKLATNLAELMQFAPRVSTEATTISAADATKSAFAPGSPEWAATQPHFDADASVVLTEKLPLRLLAGAAKSEVLPRTLRADVAIAAWTRAIELKNESVAREITPVLSELVPELKNDLEEYSAARGDGREFAPILVLLRNPGFRPFVSASPGRGWFYSAGETHFNGIAEFGDNWWCRFLPEKDRQSYGGGFYYMFAKPRQPLEELYSDGVVPSPDFLSPQDQETAAKEFSALAALPSAPRWLGQLAVDWANAHPDDVRVPEALHGVVRAWRYGECGETETATGQPKDQNVRNFSKEAFEILHKRYPDNAWTKKTPYWFN
jgi:tetratricopeptide (TPR) repeat protein